jgi:hypothetical protein
MMRGAFRADQGEEEFFARLLNTAVFGELAGVKAGGAASGAAARPVVTSVLETVLGPGADETARRMCLEAAGRLCCDMFLERSGLDTETSIDTFIDSLARVWDGHREVWREGDLIHDDFSPTAGVRSLDGECGCPLKGISSADPTSLCRICALTCQKAMYEAVVKHPVQVQLLRSPLCTGTFSCRWLIDLCSSP